VLLVDESGSDGRELLVHKGSSAKLLRVDNVWRGSAGEILPAFQDIAGGDVLAAGNERGVISSVQWPESRKGGWIHRVRASFCSGAALARPDLSLWRLRVRHSEMRGIERSAECLGRRCVARRLDHLAVRHGAPTASGRIIAPRRPYSLRQERMRRSLGGAATPHRIRGTPGLCFRGATPGNPFHGVSARRERHRGSAGSTGWGAS
jgi:hypothetical protein